MPIRTPSDARGTDTWDVVVAGGGPAGCAAAASAAEEGMRVLLIERTGALGGMGTSGLVPAWCPFSDGEKVIHRGIAARVFEKNKASCPHVPPEATDWVPIHAEHLKRVYDDLLETAGVTVLFHSLVAGVEVSGDRLEAVVVANKSGLASIQSRFFVDASGDGDVAAWAGCPFEEGDPEGETQPMTLCFSLSNVDLASYRQGGKPTRAALRDRVDLSRYHRFSDLHVSNVQTGPDVIGFNAGHLWHGKGTDPGDLSAAMTEGRRIAEDFRAALADYFPDTFGAAHLVATAALPGVRESRRIRGEYLLTIEDYLMRRTFEDDIARNAYPVDLHPAARDITRLRQEGFDVMAQFDRYRPGESHGIPYRCLIPQHMSNLLVAGRCISTDRTVQASIRVMPVSMVVGEAAGVAASLACRGDGRSRAVNAGALRARLAERGAYLPGA